MQYRSCLLQLQRSEACFVSLSCSALAGKSNEHSRASMAASSRAVWWRRWNRRKAGTTATAVTIGRIDLLSSSPAEFAERISASSSAPAITCIPCQVRRVLGHRDQDPGEISLTALPRWTAAGSLGSHAPWQSNAVTKGRGNIDQQSDRDHSSDATAGPELDLFPQFRACLFTPLGAPLGAAGQQ